MYITKKIKKECKTNGSSWGFFLIFLKKAVPVSFNKSTRHSLQDLVNLLENDLIPVLGKHFFTHQIRKLI